MTRIARIRPFTNRIVNPITRRFAGWMPGSRSSREIEELGRTT
jgi:hypothetical protein